MRNNPKIFILDEGLALRSDEPIGYQTLTSLWDRHEVTKTLILKVLSGFTLTLEMKDLIPGKRF